MSNAKHFSWLVTKKLEGAQVLRFTNGIATALKFGIGFNFSVALLFVVVFCCTVRGANAGRTDADTYPQTSDETSAVRKSPRHLIISLDGVGFSTLEQMRTEGRFKDFQKPSRMIAPFPSLTNPAMSVILESAGADESPGYEETFFDVSANRLRGGIFDRFSNRSFIKNSFRELFDYHPSALKSGLGYAAPPVSTYLESITDIIRLRQKFNASTAQTFFAYSGATDSLAHLGGKKMLRGFLKQLENTIADLQKDYQGELRVTIFSDHGNHFMRYRRSDIQQAVRRAAFKITNSLRDESSVVIPQFGLIGCAVLFTDAAHKNRLAEAAVQAKGVDFAAYSVPSLAGGEIVYVISADGRATIERRIERRSTGEQDLYRYTAQVGDPLGLAIVTKKLTETFTDGFITPQAWFTATYANARPYAAVRIYRGTTGLVRHRASVIVNFRDGYYSGSRALDLFAFLRATHGNIGREQSSGFVIDTHRTLPSVLPAEDVWAAIGNPQINKTAK